MENESRGENSRKGWKPAKWELKVREAMWKCNADNHRPLLKKEMKNDEDPLAEPGKNAINTALDSLLEEGEIEEMEPEHMQTKGYIHRDFKEELDSEDALPSTEISKKIRDAFNDLGEHLRRRNPTKREILQKADIIRRTDAVEETFESIAKDRSWRPPKENDVERSRAEVRAGILAKLEQAIKSDNPVWANLQGLEKIETYGSEETKNSEDFGSSVKNLENIQEAEKPLENYKILKEIDTLSFMYDVESSKIAIPLRSEAWRILLQTSQITAKASVSGETELVKTYVTLDLQH